MKEYAALIKLLIAPGAAQWEAEMIDIYSSCAIRHNKLIEWVEGLK